MGLAEILVGACRNLLDQLESLIVERLRRVDSRAPYLGARMVRRRRVTSLASTFFFSSSSSERNCSYSRSRTILVETWARYPNMVNHLCCTLEVFLVRPLLR